MKLDRALQLDLLNQLAAIYPIPITTGSWLNEDRSVNANLHYLAEHELITCAFHTDLKTGFARITSAKISAAGLDFLEDDGGLSAILGVVTVKLHEESIRQLLIDRINEADVQPEQRETLLARIRSLPGKGLEKLTEKMLEKGADKLIEQGPRLFDLLTQVAG